jgi:hypothetical protein
MRRTATRSVAHTGYARLMATRSIVTSQPDVTCDVCDRRLLRGEHPETFLAAGQRRTVCELCAPRATHEGWLRESGSPSVSVAPLRPRRGRNLFDRLRQAGKPNDAAPRAAARSRSEESERAVYDVLDDLSAGSDELLEVPVDEVSPADRAPVFAGADQLDRGEPEGTIDGAISPAGSDLFLGSTSMHTGGIVERAIDMFNAGEHPRRVAGVARSLGVPSVNVRPDKDFGTLVSIVVAWELCWYRYGVDVEDRDAGARVLAQGTELSELAREERLANAVADELGALSLIAA